MSDLLPKKKKDRKKKRKVSCGSSAHIPGGPGGPGSPLRPGGPEINM